MPTILHDPQSNQYHIRFRFAGREFKRSLKTDQKSEATASLARLNVPGFRVFRWERQWHTDGQPFRDPAEYPAISVATSAIFANASVSLSLGA